MAHRQSGVYKEEPGVAVTGDHVSTQRLRLPLRVVTFGLFARCVVLSFDRMLHCPHLISRALELLCIIALV